MRNFRDEPIDITVAGSPSDPRGATPNVSGVRLHHALRMLREVMDEFAV